MKKQELIKRIEQLFAFGSRDYIERNEVLNLVKQLDEPEKVKIPEFAADVIEGARGNSAELEDALFYAHEHGNQEFKNWYGKLENRENFARAFLDGYDIKQEKRYTVVMKTTKQPLYYNVLDKKLFFSMGGLATKFTRKELEEAGFGWVFSCEGCGNRGGAR